MAVLNEDATFYLQGSGSSFTTTFSSPIVLSQNTSYEIGLIKIIYPGICANVYDGQFSFYSFREQKVITREIPVGFYDIPDEFTKVWQSVLGEDAQFYELVANKNTHKMGIVMKSNGQWLPYLLISKNLSTLLGLPGQLGELGFTESVTTWNESSKNDIIYVYCDIANYVNFGATLAPLLCATAFKRSEYSVEYEPKNILYVPISKDVIDSIRIRVQNHDGMHFPFLRENLAVILHIRPSLPRL